ncbi:hypothetical protein BWZ20_10235 [Winogradskyella sp. J14-2]|uniref:lamin tail domain-containing protein n=1 Tax=Winogradskyella sp. J14-2 TaxID=1936080 RepID=UPI000972BF37|nr:T9SS type A sorting domain-containing protein [Winogradskyella sp. J14-2]APY08657.1 hypothetical protein BWZ20_10235 [Winogradskyella sp. J14-2]
MKIRVFIIALASLTYSFSQTDLLFLSKESIYTYNGDTTEVLFEGYNRGSNPSEMLTIDNQIYGLVENTSISDGNAIWRFNPADLIYEFVLGLDDTSGTNRPISNIIRGENGNFIFGIMEPNLFSGGQFAVSINLQTLEIIHLFNLESHDVDENTKMLHYNGKLYGTSLLGGANNLGFLYEFDLSNGIFTVLYSLSGNELRLNELVTGANGELYAVTQIGSFTLPGQVLEIDTENSTITPVFDLSFPVEQVYSNNDGFIYGIFEGASGYFIDRIDPVNNTQINVFQSTNGNNDNVLLPKRWAVIDDFSIHAYMPNTNTSVRLVSLNLNTLTSNVTTLPIPASKPALLNSELYTLDTENIFGRITKLEQSNTNTNEVFAFGNYGLGGSDIIMSSSGVFYGVTRFAENFLIPDGHTLFSFDPTAQTFNVIERARTNFNNTSNLEPGPFQIIELNGAIYIFCSSLSPGNSLSGAISKYNPSNDQLSLLHVFQGNNPSYFGFGWDNFAHGNSIYGLKYFNGGGNNTDNSSIFKLDTTNDAITVLYEGSAPASIRGGKTTNSGLFFEEVLSDNSRVIKLLDYTTNNITTCYQLNTSPSTIIDSQDIFTNLKNRIVELSNGDIYMIATVTDNNGQGGILKYDAANNSFNLVYQFNHDVEGFGQTPYIIKQYNNDDLQIFTANQNPSFVSTRILRFDSSNLSSPQLVYERNANPKLNTSSLLTSTNDITLINSSTGFDKVNTLGGSLEDAFDFNGAIRLPEAILDLTELDVDNPQISEIYFSEYVEGSGNNKALEIINNTGAPVNLSNYSIRLAFNGSSFGSPLSFPVGDIISDGSAYVIANSGLSVGCQGVENLVNNPMTSFNGNDAIGLFKNGVLIDIIGSEGNASNYAQNITLIRNSSVTGPSTTFDINQWTSLSQDDCSDLGDHTLNVDSSIVDKVLLYPNPTSGMLQISTAQSIKSLHLFDALGKTQQIKLSDRNIVDLSALAKGVYVLAIETNTGTINKKIIKQ